MDKKVVKKIIAREGLIILGIIILGGSTLFLSTIYPPYPQPIQGKTLNVGTAKPLTDLELFDIEIAKGHHLFAIDEIKRKRGQITNISLLMLYFAYPLYLLIRFIIWAIKTLKEK